MFVFLLETFLGNISLEHDIILIKLLKEVRVKLGEALNGEISIHDDGYKLGVLLSNDNFHLFKGVFNVKNYVGVWVDPVADQL